jgi:hypothetical protein
MARHQHTGAKHGICAFRQTSENFFMWPHLQSKYDTISSPVMQPSYLYFESRIVMYSKNNFQNIRTHLLLIVCHHSGWWVALGKGPQPSNIANPPRLSSDYMLLFRGTSLSRRPSDSVRDVFRKQKTSSPLLFWPLVHVLSSHVGNSE